jgi:type II secretory pathway component GspD/PulD (secretin)
MTGYSLFSSDELVSINTETIVLITPRIVDQTMVTGYRSLDDRIGAIGTELIIDHGPVFELEAERDDPGNTNRKQR